MSQPWSALFLLNSQALMGLNLADVTQDQADRPPAPNVNSVMWVLTHVLQTRRWFLHAVFDAAGRPAKAEPATLGDIKAAMAETHEVMAKAFDAVVDWKEQRMHPLFQTLAPLDQIVGSIFMHEAYHLGQLGTARKLLGLPGALKPPPTAQI
jgi:uncharacterized damage-inducible protein DinB